MARNPKTKQYMAWASKASFGPELGLMAAVHLEARHSYAFLKVGGREEICRGALGFP